MRSWMLWFVVAGDGDGEVSVFCDESGCVPLE